MKKVSVLVVCVCLFVLPVTAAWGAVDYKKAYDELITEWKSALDEYKSQGYSSNDMLDFSFYDNSAGFIQAYYAIYDIDGNGVPELILNKRNSYENIIAYIFSIKDGKPVNVFGYNKAGAPVEVPWSRSGVSVILSNGLIDSTEGDYAIYRIADNGHSVEKIAWSAPQDYSDEASLAEAEWIFYANGKPVDYDSYVLYLNEQGYNDKESNVPADINWIKID